MYFNTCTCIQSDEPCQIPLISRYLAGDASDSDSGDESGGEADDDEPKESPMGESDDQDDDKLDHSKYKKEMDDIDIVAKFAEHQRRPFQCKRMPTRNHQ